MYVSLCFLCYSLFVYHLFFCLMIRRPPISTRPYTLVPYTTLFRSADALRLLPGLHGADRRIEAGQELFGVGARFDAVCNLIDGWVALYTLLEDGRRQIVQFVLPGGVFGMFGTLSGRATRSEERRVGKECVSTWSSRW